MRLALECPTKMLEVIQPFADFDFILAKQVLDDEACATYFKDSGKLKFLDNSVNEEGEPLSLEHISDASEKIGGKGLIIAPDWIGDQKRTLEGYRKAVEKFGIEVVIGVIQGNTYEEALECAGYYGGLIAVPYDICSRKTESPEIMALRRALVVCNIPPEKNIHLLGFNHIGEFSWYKGRSNVWSIDTGIPILLGLQNKDILEPLEKKDQPTMKLMESLELNQKSFGAICRNIALFRKEIA